MKDNFKDWAVAAAIRSAKTVAQTAVGMISVGLALPLSEVNWLYVGSVSLTAGILSILTSIAGLPEVELQAQVKSMKEQDNE